MVLLVLFITGFAFYLIIHTYKINILACNDIQCVSQRIHALMFGRKKKLQ